MLTFSHTRLPLSCTAAIIDPQDFKMVEKTQTQNSLSGPPQFYFVDKLSATKHELEISEGMSAKDIRDLLSQTTRNFWSLIKGTRRPPHPEQGYTTADGPWRYRLSRADGSHHPERRVIDRDDTDPWRIFQTDKDLETLWEQLQQLSGCEAEGGEVEFQHVCTSEHKPATIMLTYL